LYGITRPGKSEKWLMRFSPRNSAKPAMPKRSNNIKMKDVIDVGTGAVGVTSAGVMLRSTAIGSCIVIAAYDSSKKVGAMAHIMLPGSAPRKTLEKTKYAVNAIDEMVNRMSRLGSNRGDIEVCLVGGGNVLQRQNDTICNNNIRSTIGLLKEKHIAIAARVLGGTKRKSISLDVESGSVYYTEGDKKEKLLWKSSR
jgi:chemotaxis protein CheD